VFFLFYHEKKTHRIQGIKKNGESGNSKAFVITYRFARNMSVVPLAEEFQESFAQACKNTKSHLFLVPRRIGTTTAMFRAKDQYENVQHLVHNDEDLRYEELVFPDGRRIRCQQDYTSLENTHHMEVHSFTLKIA